MFRKRVEINPAAIYSETLSRTAVEELEEEKITTANILPTFGTKFKNIGSKNQLSSQQYVDRNPVQIGRKTGTFASEVEAKIASRRLENKIREDAMKLN